MPLIWTIFTFIRKPTSRTTETVECSCRSYCQLRQRMVALTERNQVLIKAASFQRSFLQSLDTVG